MHMKNYLSLILFFSLYISYCFEQSLAKSFGADIHVNTLLFQDACLKSLNEGETKENWIILWALADKT